MCEIKKERSIVINRKKAYSTFNVLVLLSESVADGYTSNDSFSQIN